MRNERAEGYFDESGNFVWKKEVNASDAWLASLENEGDMEAMIGDAVAAKRKK